MLLDDLYLCIKLTLRPALFPNMVVTVLEYQGVSSSDPDKLPTFPDLLWDLRGLGKISENVDTAVNLYEFARCKPGVSVMLQP